MAVFTELEVEYMHTQRLGRLATAQPGGRLQVSPVGFRYNPATETIDIGGHGMDTSKKYRNVDANRQAAFVIDDVASVDPWLPRFIEIRGWGEAIEHPADSGYEARPGIPAAIIRIHPERILTMGIEPAAPGLRITARDVAVDNPHDD
jgi:pyridoxamine 5'-phosphate oxidase family protein